MDNVAVIYYYWNPPWIKKPTENFHNPILQSIQSLRYWSNVPIYILDASKETNEWEKYPAVLNFSVIKIKPFLGYGNFHLTASKPFDFFEFSKSIQEEIILVLDADAFCIKNPFPLLNNTNKFCCTLNTGVLYFNKNSKDVKVFESLWLSAINKCIKDKKYFHYIKGSPSNGCYRRAHLVNEEVVSNYLFDQCPDLFDPPDHQEHYLINPYIHPNTFKQAKIIHPAGTLWDRRGLFPLVIEDLYQATKDLYLIKKLEWINRKIAYKRLTSDEMFFNNLKTEINKLSRKF